MSENTRARICAREPGSVRFSPDPWTAIRAFRIKANFCSDISGPLTSERLGRVSTSSLLRPACFCTFSANASCCGAFSTTALVYGACKQSSALATNNWLPRWRSDFNPRRFSFLTDGWNNRSTIVEKQFFLFFLPI